MAASTGDKITDVRNAARPNSARATGTRSAGGTSLACDNLAGWPTSTTSKVHFVTYQIDSSSEPVAGTQLDCSGIVSGNTIGSFTVIDGTDTGNSVNDVVEMLPTASWAQDLADALTNQHSRTGAHVGVNNTGGLTTDTLTVSSGTTLPAGDIVTADIATDGVTDAKLIYGKLRSRQGGSATNWTTAGTTTYDYSATNIFTQAGANTSSAGAAVTVTFPTAFNQVPLIFGTVKDGSAVSLFQVESSTATQFTFGAFDTGGARVAVNVAWWAIGE